MLKLFRKIRKELLSNGKIGQYLKYAFGEIALVVMGILIAIQIDNLNEERKQLAYGQELMQELVVEINKNISILNWAIQNNQEASSVLETMYGIEDLRSLPTDSLFNFFAEANIDIQAPNNTYEKIKSQGITRLSKNEELNNKINLYFNLSVMTYNRRISFYLDRQAKRRAYLKDNLTVNFNYDPIKGFDPVDEVEMKKEMVAFLNLSQTKQLIIEMENDLDTQLSFLISYKEVWESLVVDIHNELSKSMDNLDPLPDFDKL
ncbi:hypothetical protein [Marinoscillum pacificum]|uniref:hypothetical protein n=1 Tax=Marinoscillum pacificum TaxID=392723 RepID=UPI00215881A6|nr:hypothetical protein [Marinoscillum pacificum]